MRITLRTRLLLFTLGIVVALVGLSLAVIHRSVEGRIRSQLIVDLRRAGSVFETIMADRATNLHRQSLVVAEDPRFSATLDIPDPDLQSHVRTVIPVAKQFQSIIGSDLFITTNKDGRVLARLEVSDRIEELIIFDDGRWLVEGNAYDVVTVAVEAGDNPIGSLSIGFAGEVDTTGLEDHLLAVAASSLAHAAVGVTRGSEANDLLRELRQTFAPDLIAIAGADSSSPSPRVELCRVSYGEDFSSYEPVVDALNGLKVSDFYVEAERLYHLVAVPVFARENIIGTLSAGFMIDDTLAANLGGMMDSLHVSFVHDGQVVASTWDASQRRELQHWVQSGLQADHPVEVMIAAETYLSLAGEFTPARLSRRGGGNADRLPEPGGYYIIQLSIDRALEFLDELERVLLLIGLAVMVVGGLLSFLGARRITRPILALVDGTERLAAGDLQHRLDVKTRSEIGQLARSFNDMVSALSHSRLALEESERAYRDLFDNAHDLVFTTDLDMQITSVNNSGLRSLGYAADEVVGRSMYSLLAPADAGRVQQQEELATTGERRPAFEASFVRNDGSRETFEFVSRWIVENGVTTGVHAIGRDISERREREQATLRFRERLHQAEKLRALGEMAAGVAHNFNNLLTVVLGNAELINMHEDLPPALKADTERILESAQRCSAIVRRIQTFGRPVDTEDRGRVDLSEVVRETVDLTSPKWKTGPARAGHPVSIDTDLGDVPTIDSQGAAWEEILSNLIFNAVDAMPTGGTITISTRHVGGEIVLAVADEGTGMDEETRRRIFEPFFTTKTAELGTGLGLSTVWGLAQTMGARVGVESLPGDGTTFTIRVPVATETETADVKSAAVGADSAGESLRILVIDDEPRILEILPPLLEHHRVETAIGGVDGLERVGSGGYDIVISDWIMAEVSGLEIAQEVKANSPGAVVILMTGWDFAGTDADPKSVVDFVLRKPFDHKAVEQVIDQAAQQLARTA